MFRFPVGKVTASALLAADYDEGGQPVQGAGGLQGSPGQGLRKGGGALRPHGGDGGGAEQCDESPECECCCFVGSGRELPVTLDCFGFLQANLAELSV